MKELEAENARPKRVDAGKRGRLPREFGANSIQIPRVASPSAHVIHLSRTAPQWQRPFRNQFPLTDETHSQRIARRSLLGPRPTSRRASLRADAAAPSLRSRPVRLTKDTSE